MDPYNPGDPNALGPDGLPLHHPRQPPPPQAQGDVSGGIGDGLDATAGGIDVVTDGGFFGGVGDLMSGAVDLAGSALSGTADVVGSMASGAADIVGSVASGAGGVVSAAADGIGPVLEGAGGAADGCGSCSLAFVLFFLAAGSAFAAVMR